MNKTPFFSKHIDFGANMVDFFGFSLPIYYGLKLEDQKKVIRHINKFI